MTGHHSRPAPEGMRVKLRGSAESAMQPRVEDAKRPKPWVGIEKMQALKGRRSLRRPYRHARQAKGN